MGTEYDYLITDSKTIECFKDYINSEIEKLNKEFEEI